MKFLILFAVFGFVAADPSVYRQPLIRVESRKEKMIEAGTWDSYYKNKQLLQQSFDDQYQNMNDFDEVQYVANVNIGTPRRAFKFHYDLTSMDFWVTDKTCGTDVNLVPRCPPFCYKPGGSSFCNPKCAQGKTTGLGSTEEICSQKTKYDSSQSSTFHQPNEPFDSNRDYEFGYISGNSGGEDKIELLADELYLSEKSASFLQTKEMSPVFADTPFDGILGFGPSSTCLINADDKVMKKMYTVYLKDSDDDEYNVTGGYITFGGIDGDCNDQYEYQSPLTRFDFPIYNVTFGTPENSPQNIPVSWQVTVDTGRTSIVGPSEIIKSLKEAAGADENGKIDCDAEIKDLSIKMGIENDSKILTIPAKHLIIKNSDGSCNIALDSMPPSMDYNNRWIFGVPWFRSYCNVFSFESDYKISFTKIRDQ